jgi:hypothetical protein
MADRAEEGETYRVKEGTFSWNTHYNGKEVTALESYNSRYAEIEARCHCCGATFKVAIGDLES